MTVDPSQPANVPFPVELFLSKLTNDTIHGQSNSLHVELTSRVVRQQWLENYTDQSPSTFIDSILTAIVDSLTTNFKYLTANASMTLSISRYGDTSDK